MRPAAPFALDRLRHWLRSGALGLALLSLGSLVGGGCAALPLNRLGKDRAQANTAPLYTAPQSAAVGHILTYDPATRTALVEYAAHARVPDDLAGRTLHALEPQSLQLTARLRASAHRTGVVLGVNVLEGLPAPDDVVVLPPPVGE